MGTLLNGNDGGEVKALEPSVAVLKPGFMYALEMSVEGFGFKYVF